MNYPKISILIPTYNRAKYLAECLESVLAQNYPNFEVIVSDNHSSDNTRQVMEKYLPDKRVRYYCNETNIGIIPNWKMVLYEYATGEYGKLIPDDDYLVDKQHLKKGMDLILAEKVDLVLSGGIQKVEYADGSTNELSYDFNIPRVTDTNWWLENGGHKDQGKYLFVNFVIGGIFNIRKAKELKIFMPDSFGIDYEALFRFVLSGKTGYLNGHHFVGRLHFANDGSVEKYENALKGAGMFSRIYEYGLSLGLPKKKLLSFKRRNLIIFANTFLAPKWFREKGVSLASIAEFSKIMEQIDNTISAKIITSYPTICWLLRLKNEKLYNRLRAIIRKY